MNPAEAEPSIDGRHAFAQASASDKDHGFSDMTLAKVFYCLALAGSLATGIPAAAKSPEPAMKAAPAAAKGALVDINTAPKTDLMALKGVGDKRAYDIVKGRPYKGKDDLVQKKILPQAIYDGIKDKIIAKQK